MKNFIKKNRKLFNIYIKYFWKPRKNTLTDKLYSLTKDNELTTCIQIGANDGRVNDPIFRLIRKNKWKVAFVEPQSRVFKILHNITYRANPQHFYFNSAISEERGFRPFYSIGFSDLRWAHGLSSFFKESLVNAYDSGYVERCVKSSGETIPNNPSELIKTSMIECITFEDILDEVESDFNNKVDLLLIDTEGFDYEIIKLYPFSRLRPGIIVYEHHQLSNADYMLSKEMLRKENYKISDIGNDTIAISKDYSVE